jgi:hypothetical protein
VQYRHPERFGRLLATDEREGAKAGLDGDLHPSQYAEVAAGAFEVATNKHVNQLIGQRLWVIGGEGQPRHYYLGKSYLIAEVGEYGDDPDFRFFVRGHTGVRFQPPILLNPLPWFPAFRKSQSNFSFGLNRIHEQFVSELLMLLSNNSSCGGKNEWFRGREGKREREERE